jgi:endonuclease-3 related protein
MAQMDLIADTLTEIYRRLLAAYGPQHWWPADSPLEVMIGAVLTQNTAWHAVEKAMANLKSRGLLSVQALRRIPQEELAPLLRPAGYFRLKTRRLKNLISLVSGAYGGDLERMAIAGTPELREALLKVNGIGPETADSILLYAFRRPVFVVDAYTLRVMSRHGLIGSEATYHGLQELFLEHLAEDEVIFNEYHALLVRVGKAHCRRTPLCPECPLEPLLT